MEFGIPPQEIGKVFHRFYRGESQQVAATQGTGIGLYLSRKILEEQGGTIVAGSMGEGRGKQIYHIVDAVAARDRAAGCGAVLLQWILGS